MASSVRSKKVANNIIVTNTTTTAVTYTPAEKPTQAYFTATATTPIAKERSFKSIQKIVIGKNGEVNVNEIDLGVSGDSNVIKLQFDTGQLDWYQSRLDQYEPLLIFSDGTAEPLIYSFDGLEFIIPFELTKKNVSYKVIFVLRELPKGGGNIENSEDEKEIFVSSEFRTTIPKPSHIKYMNLEEVLKKAEEDEVLLSSLAKQASLINFNNNANISFNNPTKDSFLGFKGDRFIKQLIIKRNLEENFSEINNWYVSYYNTTVSKNVVIKCKNEEVSGDLIAWIPAEVTNDSGVWEIELIGVKDFVSLEDINETVIYCSNLLTGQVKQNFLISDLVSIEPNRGNDGNLLTIDGFYLVLSDNYTLNVKDTNI